MTFAVDSIAARSMAVVIGSELDTDRGSRAIMDPPPAPSASGGRSAGDGVRGKRERSWRDAGGRVAATDAREMIRPTRERPCADVCDVIRLTLQAPCD